MNIIAIDCGASYVKGACFQGSRKIREIKRLAPGPSIKPLATQNKIISLCDLTKEILLDLCSEQEDNILCISNEMHGFVLANSDGYPITDYISWQVDLGDVVLRNSTSMAHAIMRTGMPIRGGLPSSNLSWLMLNRKFNEDLYFYTLGDYLLRYLSRKEPYAHSSNVAATGLYDLEKNDWNFDLIAFIHASKIIFPSILSGQLEFMLDGKKIIAFPAIGDHQAALLGAGMKSLETLSFNLGTGAQVSKLSEKIVFSEKWQVRPYFDGKYLFSIPHIPSGRAINVYFRFIKSVLEHFCNDLSDEIVWNEIIKATQNGSNTKLSIDLAFFENAINKNTKGSIQNIAEYELTMDNLFLAIFKQLVENCCTAADTLWNNRESVHEILFSGGLAERFTIIRNLISKSYPSSQIRYSLGDTLEGLMKYAFMCLEYV